jgi:hypothetical protein
VNYLVQGRKRRDRGCALTPTYLQYKLTFNLDDYGKKYGITLENPKSHITGINM